MRGCRNRVGPGPESLTATMAHNNTGEATTRVRTENTRSNNALGQAPAPAYCGSSRCRRGMFATARMCTRASEMFMTLGETMSSTSMPSSCQVSSCRPAGPRCSVSVTMTVSALETSIAPASVVSVPITGMGAVGLFSHFWWSLGESGTQTPVTRNPDCRCLSSWVAICSAERTPPITSTFDWCRPFSRCPLSQTRQILRPTSSPISPRGKAIARKPRDMSHLNISDRIDSQPKVNTVARVTRVYSSDPSPRTRGSRVRYSCSTTHHMSTIAMLSAV